jgi:Rod binding domain-containing protein
MPGFRMTPTVDAALLTTAAPPAGKTPSKLADAARQFESLLIGEMLKSARESQSAMGLAETQFAQAISSQGGFGLAKTIERSVASQSVQKEKAAPETASTGSLQ